jgi:hypothetical protein
MTIYIIDVSDISRVKSCPGFAPNPEPSGIARKNGELINECHPGPIDKRPIENCIGVNQSALFMPLA